ncbi:hypothetical protein CAS74_002243 [Pichia kudriavzevii]|uniref:Protein LUC7 n=1 Tax=Pichia kudriavzevii TaxID=4909 RepID=A0A099P256_PICKU|nr:uncharacterized protein C5L36_0D02710 [Pichia kudriavzevii]AWU77527.1 hypothetical protein C5L36_0D02710 [Pichia kudriavzevii]KGK38349.1 hypothetical protein JL09_g2554 [Pichia kudriavzevii]ONH74530.1 Protein LUC7 [Pichia kudriavzevii]OUT22505.1 hypothetical protein CAS74_002243 [Pichia kudriavzevii]
MTYLTPRQEQRKLLSNLLGSSMYHLPAGFDPNKPNVSLTREDIDVRILESPSVCKPFLLGVCPYEVFDGTKENVGRCRRSHNLQHRLIYERAVELGIPMPRSNYELDALKELERFVGDCDERVRIAEQRLDYSESDKLILNELARNVEISEMKLAILKEEILHVEDMKKKLELSILVRQSWNEWEAVNSQYNVTLEKLNSVGQQQMQVCSVCGAYMSKVDTDRRLVDHFTGKIHQSYVLLREKLKELREKHEED